MKIHMSDANDRIKQIEGLISSDSGSVLIDSTWLEQWVINHFEDKRVKVTVEVIE